MDAYLLPHKAVLKVRGRLTKADGSGDYTAQEITLTNGGTSLFWSGKYEMNNHTVEEINEFLPQASTIMNLLSYSKDYGRSSATNMLCYKDTGTAGASSAKYITGAELVPTARVGDTADKFDTGSNIRTALGGATPLPLDNGG